VGPAESVAWRSGYATIEVTGWAGSVAAVAAWRDDTLALLQVSSPDVSTDAAVYSIEGSDAGPSPHGRAASPDAAALVAAGAPAPGKPPHSYKTVVAVSAGLYPFLVFVGAAAGEAALSGGAHPLLGTLVTICTAVPLVVFVASPMVAMIMGVWMRDHQSGECACCPARVRFCMERGCLTKEQFSD
jgi:hypothetical protein